MSEIVLDASYASKLAVRRAITAEHEPTSLQSAMLDAAPRYSYQDLASSMMRRHLSFEEAFAAACYVLRASNSKLNKRFFQGSLTDFGAEGNRLAARELLSSLAMKEAWNHLTTDEVAGLVTATMLDVAAFPNYGDRVIETCGMGGDRGVKVNGEAKYRKTINGSTLSALVLASLGIKVAKHGSYNNTSAVGSTNAIEQFGVNIDHADMAEQQRMADTRFHFTDAHAWKTIHDLSHLHPRRETVNHVIGPMTPPIGPATRLDKVVGVNEKLHPEIMAKSYANLAARGVFKVGNVAAVCGLGLRIESADANLHSKVRDLVVLDEVSPYATVVAFCQGTSYLGTYVLTPADFGLQLRDATSIFVVNDNDLIMEANRVALSGRDDGRQLVEYLAMNAALALYLVECMDDDTSIRAWRGPNVDALRACYQKCFAALCDGRAADYLESLVG